MRRVHSSWPQDYFQDCYNLSQNASHWRLLLLNVSRWCLATYMNAAARASLCVSPQMSEVSSESLEVTSQRPEDTGPDNTHDGSSCAPSSGRALGNLRTEPSLRSLSCARAALSSCPRPGPAAAGQMSRWGQRLVSPGLERESAVPSRWSPSDIRTESQGLITLHYHATLSHNHQLILPLGH